MIYVMVASKADIRVFKKDIGEPVRPFFGLSSRFLDFRNMKIYLGKFWQLWKFLNFSATSALVSYQ